MGCHARLGWCTIGGEHNNLGSTTAQENAATQQRQNAATGYGNLASMGYADLLANGLGPSPVAGSQALTTSSGIPTAIAPGSGAQDTGGSGYGLLLNEGTNAYNQAVSGGNNAIGQYENAAGLNYTAGATPVAQNTNPYSLTPAEQTELNQQIDQLNQAQKNTQNTLAASYAARGINDPNAIAASQAMLQQAYGAAINNHSAQFAQAAQTNRQNAAQSLASYYAGQQGGGAALQQAGIGGALGLISGGSAGQLSTAGANQEAAQASQSQANQVANQVNSSIGNILNLGGKISGASGLFGGQNLLSGGSTPTATTDTSSSAWDPTSSNATLAFNNQPAINSNFAGTGNASISNPFSNESGSVGTDMPASYSTMLNF